LSPFRRPGLVWLSAQRIRARATKKIVTPSVLWTDNNSEARAIRASLVSPSTAWATSDAIQPSAMLDRISSAVSQ